MRIQGLIRGDRLCNNQDGRRFDSAPFQTFAETPELHLVNLSLTIVNLFKVEFCNGPETLLPVNAAWVKPFD